MGREGVHVASHTLHCPSARTHARTHAPTHPPTHPPPPTTCSCCSQGGGAVRQGAPPHCQVMRACAGRGGTRPAVCTRTPPCPFQRSPLSPTPPVAGRACWGVTARGGATFTSSARQCWLVSGCECVCARWEGSTRWPQASTCCCPCWCAPSPTPPPCCPQVALLWWCTACRWQRSPTAAARERRWGAMPAGRCLRWLWLLMRGGGGRAPCVPPSCTPTRCRQQRLRLLQRGRPPSRPCCTPRAAAAAARRRQLTPSPRRWGAKASAGARARSLRHPPSLRPSLRRWAPPQSPPRHSHAPSGVRAAALGPLALPLGRRPPPPGMPAAAAVGAALEASPSPLLLVPANSPARLLLLLHQRRRAAPAAPGAPRQPRLSLCQPTPSCPPCQLGGQQPSVCLPSGGVAARRLLLTAGRRGRARCCPPPPSAAAARERASPRRQGGRWQGRARPPHARALGACPLRWMTW